MVQRLKKFFSAFFIVILALVVLGVPSFHHDCSLRGQHNFYSGFFVEESENHCVCCEEIDNQSNKCSSHSENHAECCDVPVADTQSPAITHSQCCQIQAIAFQITTTFQSTHDLKFCVPVFDLPEIISNFQLPDNYTDFFVKSIHSPFEIYKNWQSIIFLFSQFLL